MQRVQFIEFLSLQDVIQHNCNELIQVVPFFLNAEEAFISSLLTRLKFEVFLPNEIIIHFGVVGSKMYFIQHGTVDILNSEGDIIKSLSDGAYFGGQYSLFISYLQLFCETTLKAESY